MKVRCLRRYSDLKLGRDVLEGEELEMAKERAEELAGTENKAGIALVEIIGTENETDQAENETDQAENETDQAENETDQAENETVSESDTKKKRTSKKKAADE
jgi:hypothetical protein